MVQILLQTTKDKILIVTFTNHALDDLLEDVLNAGITDIVRIGGRSRSDRLAEYNLREQAHSGKTPFTREQTRRYAQLKQTIEEAEKDVTRLERILKREIGEKWWDRVGDFLRSEEPESWRQLRLEDSDIVDRDGFKVEGLGRKDDLWKRWLKGKGLPFFLQDRRSGPLWSLTKAERTAQKIKWQHLMYETNRSAMEAALKTIDTANIELKQLKETKDAAVLASKRIIGCTTTKAAMSKSLLDGLSAGIVLVEEAAEIMEAHVITSLSSGAKRLIMIGDHKQLRPKCQNYSLTVESGRGFDLNISLFERLATVLPVSMLRVQHRMHPEISSVPRLVTYPELEDAEAVRDHPLPTGLDSRLVFLDHDIEEDREKINDESLDSVSRINTYEVDMVRGVVRYLFQQGYNAGDMVVLTPYLGQMVEIQKELSLDYDIHLDDRDLKDARDSHIEIEVKRKEIDTPNKPAVRVATIDNYQGEEAKIVIASLVRSNDRGEIGFLKEAERVNVMLSRARDCEIIIGNKRTFENARGSCDPLRGGPLWKKIFECLESKGAIFDGVPLRCKKHGTLTIVRDPADFSIFCPHGGCNVLCDQTMDCGHPCKKRCHIGPCNECRVICQDTCPRGHRLMRECSLGLPKCQVTIEWRCPLNHRNTGPCYNGKYHSQCHSCLQMKQEFERKKEKEELMQKQLESKYHSLEKANNRLHEALEKNRRKVEFVRIEKELALAEEALEAALQTQVSEPLVPTYKHSTMALQASTEGSVNQSSNVNEATYCSIVNPMKDFDTKVRATLQSSYPKPMDANELLRKYKANHGTDLKQDAEKLRARKHAQSSKSKKKQKLKEILSTVPCCDVVIAAASASDANQTTMLVRLRERSTEDTNGASGAVTGESSQKRARTVAVDSIYTDVSPKAGPKKDLPQSRAFSDDLEANNEDKGVIDIVDEPPNLPRVSSTTTKCHSSTDDVVTVKKVGTEEPTTQLNEEAVVVQIMNRYTSSGALSADSLLDQLVLCTDKSDGLLALQAIIRGELDPTGIMDAAPYPKESQPVLIRALCSLSEAFRNSREFPLQAKGYAKVFLKYVRDLSTKLPAGWIERATTISDQSFEKKPAPANAAETSLEDEWNAVLARDANSPQVMQADILPMIGLQEVKKSFIRMHHRARLSMDQDDCAAASYNVRFEGNPGTGKTTIARHYGKFLQQLGVLGERTVFREISGAKLIYDGIKGLKDMLDEMKEAGGGIIFVDEAYQLKSDREGKKALDFILPLAEKLQTEYGDLVWIFAGYKKPMEALFEHNEGLPSRFPLRFVFEDYTDSELQRIFEDMMMYKDGVSKKPEDKRKAKHSSTDLRSLPRYSSSYYVGAAMEGRYGGTWTYKDQLGWTDIYGNLTVDPKRVGTAASELMTSTGTSWTEKNGIWTNSSGLTQSYYPGSPPPIKVREKRPTAFRVEDKKYIRIAIRRLGRRRGETSFGNARAVRVLFEQVRDRQADRISVERKRGISPCVFTFKPADLCGPALTNETLRNIAAWKELDSKEGLIPVKESIENLFKIVLENNRREEREEKLFGVALNRLFLGNPGTGYA